MSANLVSSAHIDLLVSYATAPRGGHSVTFIHDGEHHDALHEDPQTIGDALSIANNAGVNASRGTQTPPEPYKFTPRHLATFTEVDLLKLANGYTYQSCDARDWDNTYAAAFIDGLKEHLIRQLPGYDDAPWMINSTGLLAHVRERSNA